MDIIKAEPGAMNHHHDLLMRIKKEPVDIPEFSNNGGQIALIENSNFAIKVEPDESANEEVNPEYIEQYLIDVKEEVCPEDVILPKAEPVDITKQAGTVKDCDQSQNRYMSTLQSVAEKIPRLILRRVEDTSPGLKGRKNPEGVPSIKNECTIIKQEENSSSEEVPREMKVFDNREGMVTRSRNRHDCLVTSAESQRSCLETQTDYNKYCLCGKNVTKYGPTQETMMYECDTCRNNWLDKNCSSGDCRRCQICDDPNPHPGFVSSYKELLTGDILIFCTICHRRFAQKSNLMTHIVTHSSERPFKCDVCFKGFKVKIDVDIHMRTHTGEKPYQCKVCLRSFSTAGNLLNHKRVHVGERPYECSICHKRFQRKGYLELHERTHTGARPHKCVVCDKRFTQHTHLFSHMLRHSGVRKFSCEICNKQFVTRCDVAKHMMYHSGIKPHKCETCLKSFAKKEHLIIHTRIHTGERPFKCEYCQKRFPAKVDLMKHIRKHTGEKPFACAVCGRRYTKRKYLTNHMSIHFEPLKIQVET